MRDGAEWRERGARPLRPGIVPAGVLAVAFDGTTVRADFSPSSTGAGARAKDEFEIQIALLGGGLVSKVTAGENSGETLRQEFVALGLASHALAADGAVLRAEFALPPLTVKNAASRALAAWVTRRGKFESVQATGGWLK